MKLGVLIASVFLIIIVIYGCVSVNHMAVQNENKRRIEIDERFNRNFK